MKENNDIKSDENYFSEQNTRIYHDRNSVYNKNLGISSSNIHLNFINEDCFNNETSPFNKKEMKTFSDNGNNIDVYFNNIKNIIKKLFY